MTTPVSTLDVTPTLAGLAGIDVSALAPWTDGEDPDAPCKRPGRRGIVPRNTRPRGPSAPMIGLRDARYKLTLCQADEPILVDLEADPYELQNLAAEPAAQPIFIDLPKKRVGDGI